MRLVVRLVVMKAAPRVLQLAVDLVVRWGDYLEAHWVVVTAGRWAEYWGVRSVALLVVL